MKIATFNINNINRRLANLLAWLEVAKPDVVCLQELKAADREFPIAAIESAGYGAAWCGQRTWNGVAILARDAEPVVTHRTLPGDAGDTQSRYLEAAIDGVLIACIYAPNGNPQPGPKFDYKLAWLDRLIAHARGLIDADVPVVLAGDYNVVPTPADIYPTKSWDNDALVQPAAASVSSTWSNKAGPTRSARCIPMSRCIRSGTTSAGVGDATRDFASTTCWSALRYRAGSRVAGVDKTIRGEVGASDHAPAWVLLKAPRRKRSTRRDPGNDRIEH